MSHLEAVPRRSLRHRARQTTATTMLALGLVVSVFAAPSVAEDVVATGEAGPSLAECRDRATAAKPVADGCGEHKEVLLRDAREKAERDAAAERAAREQAEREAAEAERAAREATAQRQAAALADPILPGVGDDNGNPPEDTTGEGEPGGPLDPPLDCDAIPLPIGCDDDTDPPVDPPVDPDPCDTVPLPEGCDDDTDPPVDPPVDPDPCDTVPLPAGCDDDTDPPVKDDDKDKPGKGKPGQGKPGNNGTTGGGTASTVGNAEGVLASSAAPAACGGSVACQSAAPAVTSSSNGLPDTGAPATGGLVYAGLALLLGGAALLRPRRGAGRHRSVA